MGRGRGWGQRKKKPPDLLGRLLLLLPGVLFSISHYPDQANHKRSLLRKKEDNNQANDNFEQVYKMHYELPFLPNKKAARGWGGLCFVCRCVRLFSSYRCHPNRELVLKNNDRKNNDKNKAGENGLHDFLSYFARL